jgi:hypothetical protein
MFPPTRFANSTSGSFRSFPIALVTVLLQSTFVVPAVASSIQPDWTAEIDQAGAAFGVSTATAGDVNGDGYSDVIVGASNYSNGQSGEGGAFVYLGSAAGLGSSPAWRAESNQVDAHFGISVATAGDVNADGYSDVIVGASDYDQDFVDEGRAFLYLGSATGLSTTPAWTAASGQAGARFGICVSTAGDVNGDYFSDILVGAYEFGLGGRAFAYYGSSVGPATAPSWFGEPEPEGGAFDARYGKSLASAGDVNGDDYSDIIVGASRYGYTVETHAGRAFAYYGSPSGLPASASWIRGGPPAFYQGDELGVSVGSAGDVNHDGFSDVIVGALLHMNDQYREGGAFVYHGTAAGLEHHAPWSAYGNQDEADFGTAGGTAGDLNHDGFSDVIIGAHGYDNGQVNEGQAFVYYGSGSSVQNPEQLTAEGDQASAHFGVSVGLAGDVNGDGGPDLIVGAHMYDNGELDEGRAFVYYGASTTNVPGQSTAGNLRLLPIAPNPFAHATELAYDLPQGGRVRLAIYDANGRELAVLRDGAETSGRATATWNGRDAAGRALPSGVYFVKLAYGGQVEARKVVLTR